MWQDDYISIRDDEYVCWDREGEFIGITSNIETAREIVSQYANKMNNKYSERNTELQ